MADDGEVAANLMAEEDDAAAAANAAQRQRELNAQFGGNAGNVIGNQVAFDDIQGIEDSIIRAR
jgi:hypothetical protein